MNLDVNPDSDVHLLCDLPKLHSIFESLCSHLKSEDGALCHKAVVKTEYKEVTFGRRQVLPQDLACSVNS